GALVAGLESDVTLAGGALHFQHLRGAGLGAQVTGEAELMLFPENGDVTHPLAEPMLRAELRAQGLQVSSVTEWMDTVGRAEVNLTLDGPLRDPKGEARLELPFLTLH